MQLREAITKQEIAGCLEIRRIVFIDGQGVPEVRERKDEGLNCRHFYVSENDNAIAAMRMIETVDYAKLQRMAVLMAHRGQGVGKFMLTAILKLLGKEAAVKAVQLDAQAHAVRFYERSGFTKISEAFIDAGITHYKMEREIK